jgi:hypothetical protein
MAWSDELVFEVLEEFTERAFRTREAEYFHGRLEARREASRAWKARNIDAVRARDRERKRRGSMNKMQSQVRELCRSAGLPTSPALPELRDAEFRAHKILHEAVNTAATLLGKDAAVKAVHAYERVAATMPAEPDIVGVVKSVCGLLREAFATAEALGIDIEPFFDQVIAAGEWAEIGRLLAESIRRRSQ